MNVREISETDACSMIGSLNSDELESAKTHFVSLVELEETPYHQLVLEPELYTTSKYSLHFLLLCRTDIDS